MSHAVRRVTTSAAPSGEALPTSATVLDYNCLFTHDLKRKQKRWQDGKLKYHTFNKKIMVYDDRGNFIGDAHWHAGGPLEEDEELDLDRGAAIVQVADYIGSREQDLTEVLDKRAREVEKRRAAAAAKTPASSRVRAGPAAGTAAESTPVRMIHRSLSFIVPSPGSGPLGRASIPSRSPYEARKADGSGEPRGEAPPPPPPPPARKRRRSPSPPSKAGFARSLFGAALSLSSSAGGSANRGAWAALRERGVNALAVPSAETSDDDVVVVGERPRTKASSLHRSRPKAQTMDDEIAEQRSVETSGIHGSTDNTESRPFKRATHILREERQPTPVSDESSEKNETNKPPRRTAMAHQDNHGKTTSKSAASDPPDSAPPKPQERRTELRIRSRKRRGLLVVAEKRQGQQAPPSSIATEATEQSMNGASTVAGQKLPSGITNLDGYPSKATPEHTAKSASAPEAGFGGDSVSHYLAPSPYDQPEDTNRLSSDSTPGDVVATDEPSEPPEETVDHVTECLKASDSIEAEDSWSHISLDSDTTSTARPEGEEVEAEASQRVHNKRPELPDKVEAQASRCSAAMSEAPPANISTDEESDLPPVEAQESRRSNKSEVPPANISADEESVDFPPARKSTWRRKRVELPPPSEEEMTALHNSEVMPANMSTDEESEDFPPARKTKRPRKKVEPPPSSGEMPAHLAPARRRSARMKRNSRADTALGRSSGESESDCEKSRERRPSAQTDGHLEADTAGNPSEDEVSDCASRTRPKRRQSKKDCELTGAHQTAIPAGPRIKRLARKSVKSKEIFGFIPSLEAGQTAPSPFAMTATRIGVVGRPPTAPNRLPGISLTIKPPGLCGRGSRSTDKHADTVQQPISGGQHGQDDAAAERGPDDVDAVAMAARPGAAAASASASALDQAPAGLLDSTENVVSNGGLPPRAKIANPATRGKKAARKTDAAGQAPQHVVPFEPPQPVRPVPKAKPSRSPGPSGPSAARDAPSLPGFSTAKGGAWSAHAEDLLGMTRPTGKRA
ncbi:hypothetical protein E4U54_003576 [Claviceps lovelessii]|nr:hypothetical protein E4U54_003576 [Claviceps lovelessii]